MNQTTSQQRRTPHWLVPEPTPPFPRGMKLTQAAPIHHGCIATKTAPPGAHLALCSFLDDACTLGLTPPFQAAWPARAWDPGQAMHGRLLLHQHIAEQQQPPGVGLPCRGRRGTAPTDPLCICQHRHSQQHGCLATRLSTEEGKQRRPETRARQPSVLHAIAGRGSVVLGAANGSQGHPHTSTAATASLQLARSPTWALHRAPPPFNPASTSHLLVQAACMPP
jgi:hypothetical protein